MKTNTRLITLAMAITALLGSGTLMAVTPAPMPGPIAFATYDTNSDGKVSVEEFYAARNARIGERAKQGRMMKNLGNAPAFEQFDADGDGYLSENELLKGQMNHMLQQRMSRPMGPMAGAGRAAPGRASFADFDRNGDGVVTAEEFAETRAARQADKAAQRYPMRNAGSAPSFESYDRNGDGRLTPDEFVPGQRF
ncbi:EF-hand domain-containing protein [Sedimenticola sp.]|uniref:EF-hand domain-containing protein n=1 Tax=Sedimenticola sp. TaxID=1940285 RepID=UPI003D145FCC